MCTLYIKTFEIIHTSTMRIQISKVNNTVCKNGDTINSRSTKPFYLHEAPRGGVTGDPRDISGSGLDRTIIPVATPTFSGSSFPKMLNRMLYLQQAIQYGRHKPEVVISPVLD